MPISRSTTPLLAKLHELNPSLSIESLEPLLSAHPFSLDQVNQTMDHNVQPPAFVHAADQLKTRLRVDMAVDGIYHQRVYNPDMDLWAREFAAGVLRDRLNRRLVVIELQDPSSKAYLPTGPDSPTIVLRHHGNGTYEASNFRRGKRPRSARPLTASTWRSISNCGIRNVCSWAWMTPACRACARPWAMPC